MYHNDDTSVNPQDGGRGALDYALDYMGRGWAPIDWPSKVKGANIPWAEKQYDSEEKIRAAFSGEAQNVGVKLGEPSGGLADSDRDCAEVVTLAPRFMTKTGSVFGREGKPRSHALYRVDGELPGCTKFQDLNGEMLLELRFTGHQTILPPSTHPSGEVVQWEENGEVPHIPAKAMLREHRELATAALVARHLPDGGRHDFALALLGCLGRPGRLSIDTALGIAHAAWDVAGYPGDKDPKKAYADLERIAASTAERLEADEEVQGAPTLDEYVEGLARQIAKFWGWEKKQKDGKCKPPPQSEILVGLAADAELFHDAEGLTFATVPVGEHRETHKLRTRGFTGWLRLLYYGKTGKAPGAQALQDAIGTLEAQAEHDGEAREVYVRMSGHENSIYLDLCNKEWEVVEITSADWRVIPGSEAPVRFRRAKGMLALPHPERGGDLENLRSLMNLADERSWALVLSWLVMALNPEGPYPILNVLGEQGTAKSTAVRMLRRLVDPNKAEDRASPRGEQELAIAANNGWIISYDNLSYIQPWMSDALCRVSTGGGFGTRALYENDEEALFEYTRPVCLNGITDIASKPDLLDRSVMVRLQKIEKYRSEKQVWAAYEKVRPGVLGRLLDAVSAALRNQTDVELDDPPRMVDFALWASAAEEELGLDKGEFWRAYSGVREEATIQTLENDLYASSILRFMEKNRSWEGTADDLRQWVDREVDEASRRSKFWPGSPGAVGNKMKRIAPALRSQGLEWEEDPGGSRRDGRTKRLYWHKGCGPENDQAVYGGPSGTFTA